MSCEHTENLNSDVFMLTFQTGLLYLLTSHPAATSIHSFALCLFRFSMAKLKRGGAPASARRSVGGGSVARGGAAINVARRGGARPRGPPRPTAKAGTQRISSQTERLTEQRAILFPRASHDDIGRAHGQSWRSDDTKRVQRC